MFHAFLRTFTLSCRRLYRRRSQCGNPVMSRPLVSLLTESIATELLKVPNVKS
jgi:hypothetical protein